MSNPSATATQEFDQVVEGNINIKKLSKNRYKITFSKIRKFLLYQVWSDSSKQLNDNRSVYYLKAKDWVLSNFPTSKTKPDTVPYEPTTVLVINNKRRYIFVIKNAKIKKNGKIVFDVSTDEIKLQSNISKKLLHLPEGCFKNARFDIDSYNFVAGCPGCGPLGSSGCVATCCAPGYPTPPPFCNGPSPPPPPPPPPPPTLPQLSNFNIPTPQNYPGYPIVLQITQPTSNNSSGAFTYSSSNSDIATISGSTVTFLTIGTVIITATQAASGNYSQGSIQTTVTVQLQPGVTLFQGANFVGANLSNLDLSNFNFTNANLTNANLTSANLASANLTNVNLTSANLTSANLTSANLTGTNFTNATLTNATLTNATLTSVIFVGANLSNVDLSNYDFENYNLTNTNFTSANLTSANFTSANLTSANLTSANLTSANITNATLTNATLTGAIFVGTNLSNMDFSNYDFENYNFSNANLTNANLTSVNFRSVNLTSANLKNANMYQAVISYSNINNANFSGTNLFGIVGYWTSNPTPLNLDKAIAITPNGTITGWTFIKEDDAWTLNNNNLN